MSGQLWLANVLAWYAQALLLVVAGGLLPRALGVRQPRVLLGYWRALLAACLALPLLEPWTRQSAGGAGAVTVLLGPAAALGTTHWHVAAYQVIGAVILAGALLRLAQVALGLVRLRAYRRAATPLSRPFGAVEAVQARVRSAADFRLSSSIESPVTFGWIRSVILLPERFLTMQPRLQSAIACHELVHVRRRDWPHHLMEEFLRALLWFHPAILWLIARLRLAREQAVDLEVLELLGARKPYLEALFEIAAGRSLSVAIPAPPFLVEHQLAERVTLMLKEVSMSKSRLIASLTVMCGGLVLTGALAAWAFPLKAAPQQLLSAEIVQPCAASDQACPKTGVIGGVVDGVKGGVIGGVPGGVAGGKISGVPGGVPGGVNAGAPGAIRSTDTKDGAKPTVPVSSLKIVKKVQPVYPVEAKNKHVQGEVVLKVTIQKDGAVSQVEFVSGPDELVQSATDAVKQWQYEPPAPGAVVTTITVHYTLAD